jgi:hypothetical protein
MAMLLVILPCIEAQRGGCILGKSVFPLARDPWGGRTLGEGSSNVADVKGQCYPGPFDGRLHSWLTKWKGCWSYSLVLKLKEEGAYSVKVFFRWHVIRGEPLSWGFSPVSSLIYNKDEWEQPPRLQGAFPQGRGGTSARFLSSSARFLSSSALRKSAL